MNGDHTKRKIKRLEDHRGYTALMSVLLVSGILLLVVSVSSYSGYFSRLNVLESEFKERSLALAEACADEALLNLARDASYSGNVTIVIGGTPCTIGPVVTLETSIVFRTKASFKNAHTNLRISVNRETLTTLSWEETPTDT